MATTVTFDDVWKMFQESIREADRRFQETERLMRESSTETDRKMRESSAETDRKFQEAERLIHESNREVDRKLKDLAKQVGNLSSRWGEFVESIVAPGSKDCLSLPNPGKQSTLTMTKSSNHGNGNVRLKTVIVTHPPLN